MTYDPQNVFAKILRREIPVNALFDDAFALAFNDIAPQAPIHVLVIPKGPYQNALDFAAHASQEEQLGFWTAVQTISEKLDPQNQGLRFILNNGSHAGQEVPHMHLHILGGKPLGPMLAT